MKSYAPSRAMTPVMSCRCPFPHLHNVDTRRLGVVNTARLGAVNPGHFFNAEDEKGGSHLSPDAISETPSSDGEGE